MVLPGPLWRQVVRDGLRDFIRGYGSSPTGVFHRAALAPGRHLSLRPNLSSPGFFVVQQVFPAAPRTGAADRPTDSGALAGSTKTKGPHEAGLEVCCVLRFLFVLLVGADGLEPPTCAV